MVGKQPPIDSTTRTAILSGCGGINKNRIRTGARRFATGLYIFDDGCHPSLIEPACANDIEVSMELPQKGGRFVSVQLDQMNRRIACDSANLVCRGVYKYADSFRFQGKCGANVFGFGNSNASRTAAKEIQSDGIGPGLDGSERIIDVSNTTNLNTKIHTLMIRRLSSSRLA